VNHATIFMLIDQAIEQFAEAVAAANWIRADKMAALVFGLAGATKDA
jgi:hypothetical protein